MLSLTCLSTKSFDLKKALVPIINRYTDPVSTNHDLNFQDNKSEYTKLLDVVTKRRNAIVSVTSFKSDADMDTLESYYKALVAIVKDFPCTEYSVPQFALIDSRTRKFL